MAFLAGNWRNFGELLWMRFQENSVHRKFIISLFTIFHFYTLSVTVHSKFETTQHKVHALKSTTDWFSQVTKRLKTRQQDAEDIQNMSNVYMTVRWYTKEVIMFLGWVGSYYHPRAPAEAQIHASGGFNRVQN